MSDHALDVRAARRGPGVAFMRRVLIVDAVAYGAMALLLLVLADWAAPRLGLPSPLLRGAGIVLVPWTALLLVFVLQPVISRTQVMSVIVGNVAWVVASLAVLLSGRVETTTLGTAFVVVQAAAVIMLTGIQMSGKNRLV